MFLRNVCFNRNTRNYIPENRKEKNLEKILCLKFELPGLNFAHVRRARVNYQRDKQTQQSLAFSYLARFRNCQ
jgi:hypothetical protein